MPKENRKFYAYLFVTLLIGLVGVFTVYAKKTDDSTATSGQQAFTVSVINTTNQQFAYDVDLPGDRVYINTVDPIDEKIVEELIKEQELERDADEIPEVDPQKIEESREHIIKINELGEEKDPQLFDYVKIVNSCDHDYSGVCVKIRKGPGSQFPYRGVFRNGQILRAGRVIEVEGIVWQEIVFDEWIRYPNRARDEWWVSSEYIEEVRSTGWELLEDKGDDPWRGFGKRIVVDKTNQTLKTYEYGNVVHEISVSTGLTGSATPAGLYEVRIKTPSRYMQGPINIPDGVDTDDPLLDWTELEDYYDLPGVPWNLYFSDDGLVIHGAYWHNNFGERWSHGCVNVPTDVMKEIYQWADLGTVVEVVE